MLELLFTFEAFILKNGHKHQPLSGNTPPVEILAEFAGGNNRLFF
jgi:hypothetical protein